MVTLGETLFYLFVTVKLVDYARKAVICSPHYITLKINYLNLHSYLFHSSAPF